MAKVSHRGRPLFLSANHCGFSNAVIVYWRFERPNCGSGIPDDTQTTSGAVLLADVDGSPGGAIKNSQVKLQIGMASFLLLREIMVRLIQVKD